MSIVGDGSGGQLGSGLGGGMGGGSGNGPGDGSQVTFPGGGVAEASEMVRGLRVDPERLEDEREDEASSQAAVQRIADLERELSETRAALVSAERRGDIDRELADSGAIDVETARVMTENVIAQMRIDDVAEAVAELRRTKPFLFDGEREAAVSADIGSSLMSGIAAGSGGASLSGLADSARATGDRRELARYLRARRGD